jgi:iron complex outermembrane recepter protein
MRCDATQLAREETSNGWPKRQKAQRLPRGRILMRQSQKLIFSASCCLTALLAAPSAFAQSAPDDDQDQIVVTAERRETRLLETPLAVAAIPTQQLERQGIASLEDVQAVTPNLTFGHFSNFSLVSLRGIGTDFGTISAEPSVATFQDGVYQGASSAQTVPTFDLVRVEVLRGPQGTLYGRNSTGGAINFITRDPSFSNEGNAALVVGDYDRVTADLGLSGPLGLNDTLAGRLSVRYDARGGYRDNDFLGVESDDLESRSAAGSMLIRPNDDVSFILRGDYTNRDSAQPYERIDDSLGFNTILGGAFTPDPSETTHFRNNVATETNAEVWGTSATATFDFNGTTLRSISAYRENNVSSAEDWDGSDGDILRIDFNDTAEQFTQEFNLFGTAGALDWLLGAFYYDAYGTTFFDASGGVLPAFFGANTLTYAAEQDSQSVAVFGQATYALTDRLNVTGGLRYTRDEKTMDQGILINHVIDICGTTTEESWNALTGTLSVDYHLTPDAIVYGRFARGYKAGGINAGECADAFDPEYLDAFEAGVRGTIFDRSLSGAITAFYYDYQDIQFTTFGTTTATVDNVGGATVAGIELEYNYRPAFADGLRIDGSVSYLHSEYDDQLVMDPFLTGPYQIGGNQLIRAPEWRANMGIEYEFGFTSNSDLTVRAETSYSDRYYHDLFNGKALLQAATEEPSYTISNLRLIWSARDRDLEVQLFVDNIEDHQYAYRRFVGASFGGITGQFSPPRTFGIRFSTGFGG